MHCLFCSYKETKVLESRSKEDGLRRRRECLKCHSRFTTYERAIFNLLVTKKDGRIEPFELQKLTRSIEKACGKIEQEKAHFLAQKIYQKILSRKESPIKTQQIGKLVLLELKKMNKIAYLRFATLHKAINNLNYEKE